MNHTHQQSTLDFSDLIGTPYNKLDCWGIVKEFYKRQFNLELSNYYSEIPNDNLIARHLIDDAKKDFLEVSTPEYGDILLLRLQGLPCHLGVYLNKTQILHTVKGSGCIIDRFSRWKKMIHSIYRVNK